MIETPHVSAGLATENTAHMLQYTLQCTLDDILMFNDQHSVANDTPVHC